MENVVGLLMRKEPKRILDTLLVKLISDNYDDVQVIYTRKTDVFVEVYKRAVIANNNHADLFFNFLMFFLIWNTSPIISLAIFLWFQNISMKARHLFISTYFP